MGYTYTIEQWTNPGPDDSKINGIYCDFRVEKGSSGDWHTPPDEGDIEITSVYVEDWKGHRVDVSYSNFFCYIVDQNELEQMVFDYAQEENLL